MGFIIKAEPEDFIVEEIPKQWITNHLKKGQYTYFRLTKRDLTTEEAITRIARRLNRPRKLFGYAGTKDRRAVTTQYCSVKGAFRTLQLDGLSAEPVGAGQEPISLGDLLGNRFTIRVKDADKAPAQLECVPNYFDEQRFGSTGSNADIGKAIIAGDFKNAAERAMEADQKFAQLAMAHLGQYKNDFIGALRLLPKKTALLFLHSFQSMLFNELLDSVIRSRSQDIREIEISPLGRFAVLESVPIGMMGLELPVAGFGTELAEVKDTEIRKLAEQILSSRNLSPRDFLIRQMPELSAEGILRNAFAAVEGLSVQQEMPCQYLIGFSLPPGSYATLVIKAMFAS